MKDIATCEKCRACSKSYSTKSDNYIGRKGWNMFSTNMNSFAFVVLGFLLISQCVAQDFKIDIENLVNSVDPVKPKRTEPVALHWGIADTSAVVGKMFNYVIPSDAFKGDILSYEVRLFFC